MISVALAFLHSYNILFYPHRLSHNGLANTPTDFVHTADVILIDNWSYVWYPTELPIFKVKKGNFFTQINVLVFTYMPL